MLGDKRNLQAEADGIAQLAANAEVKIETKAAEGLIVLKSDVVLPIALRPVAVPTVVGPFADLVKESKPRLTEETLRNSR